jgi:hypothetical protein
MTKTTPSRVYVNDRFVCGGDFPLQFSSSKQIHFSDAGHFHRRNEIKNLPGISILDLSGLQKQYTKRMSLMVMVNEEGF